jgi:predicted nucleic acid-binding Zn ribbon protein
MKRKCLLCNESFAGRTDKKFCSDQCRNAFNNQNKKVHEQFIANVNKTLRQNRMILHQLGPVGKSTVRREYLDKMGFDFQFFTHTYTTKNNNTYKFCYEYGYLEIEQDKILIVIWQDYMKNGFKTV